MPVTINGNGSITGLSVGGLGSGVVNNATLANGAASGNKLGTGAVIQVQKTLVTAFETITCDTSGTGSHDSSLAVSITPTSASNIIFVNAFAFGEGSAFKVMRSVNGGSYAETVALGDAVGSANRGAVGGLYDDNVQYNTDCRSIQFVDTPNTTSPVDYKIYVYVFDGSKPVYINRPHTTTALEHICLLYTSPSPRDS